MVNFLLQATEAFAEMNAIMRLSHEMDSILHDVLLIDFAQYVKLDEEIGFINVLHSIFIQTEEDNTYKQVQVMGAGTSYAKARIQATEVLTAGDLLKINYILETSDLRVLENEEVPHHLTQFIDPVWAILHYLYKPQPQYSLLLESVVTMYSLISLPVPMDLRTITLLLFTVYKNDLAFLGPRKGMDPIYRPTRSNSLFRYKLSNCTHT